MAGTGKRVYAYLDKLVGLSALSALARKKTVPEHKRDVWYFLGGICLFLVVIQVLTGALLLLYYSPSPETAYESVVYIMSQVKFGWLIRSVHAWTANILIGAAFVHMFSTFFLKAYRKPRELTWMTGVLLLLLLLAFGFSGYLLPWNKLSFFATKVGTDIVGFLPLVGKGLKVFLLGGPDVSGVTVSRFYWFHVALLPGLGVAVLGIHVLLVQTLGMSVPLGVEKKNIREVPFFPDFLLRDSVGWLLITAAVGVLCVFLPWGVGEKADPLASAPLGIRPEWFFTFMFSTLKLVPSHVLSLPGELAAILAFAAGAVFWLLVPVLDRRARKEKPSPFFTVVGLVLMLYIAVMTAVTYLLKNF
jgi:cytochrome b6